MIFLYHVWKLLHFDGVTLFKDFHLQICAVKAVPEANPMFDGVEVDDRILKYYSNNHVRHFVYDRPTYRGPADKDNEFKVSWKILMYTRTDSLGNDSNLTSPCCMYSI